MTTTKTQELFKLDDVISSIIPEATVIKKLSIWACDKLYNTEVLLREARVKHNGNVGINTVSNGFEQFMYNNKRKCTIIRTSANKSSDNIIEYSSNIHIIQGIGNLDLFITANHLASEFEKFGAITHTDIIKDRATDQFSGYGLATYKNKEYAIKAIIAKLTCVVVQSINNSTV
ncbi:hypothetical protein BDC45DRAFT_538849 [Circinella umbellata]|nr:hypothetical protein BDC45DRAFT_538849 [Circinella umbellata]